MHVNNKRKWPNYPAGIQIPRYAYFTFPQPFCKMTNEEHEVF